MKWINLSYAAETWSGEQAQIFMPKTFIDKDEKSLNYRLLEPVDFDSLQRYPLVICLHGSGGEGSDNLKQFAATWSANYLSKPEIRIKHPSYVFVPQCPVGYNWGGIEGFPNIETLVFETISSLTAEYNIDKNRVYIVGYSMGGYGTWNFVGKHPGFFAAAVPIAGAGNPSITPNLIDTPIWAFHGSGDQLVPVEGSHSMIKALLDAGGSPRYSEFPEKGHNIIAELEENAPELFDWLFDQKIHGDNGMDTLTLMKSTTFPFTY
ncbi:carboxylesterase family protein [Anditalea andensis]|nr:prolyl oligopeptidase family serine peptidase [Anditalea andensis]